MSERTNVTRPCSPVWDKWTGSSGKTPCPCPTCLTKICRTPSPDKPKLLVPLVSLRSEDPLLLVPLVPRTPTCPNLSHLVVPLVLSQLSFVRFFLGSDCHSIFRKILLNEKFFIKYYHVGESTNNNQISMKRQETTVTKHSNTWVYFV